MIDRYENDHEKIDALSADYLDGSLSSEETKWFEEHIEKCPDCRERLDAFRFMLSETAKLDEEPPEGFDEFILTGIEREVSRRRSARLTFLRPIIGAAACFVLVAVGALIGLGGMEPGKDSADAELADIAVYDAEAADHNKTDGGFIGDDLKSVPSNADDDMSDDCDLFDAYEPDDELLHYVAANSAKNFSAIIVVSDPEAVEKFDEPIVLDGGVTICELDRDTALEMLSNGDFGDDAYAVEDDAASCVMNYSEDSDTVVAVLITD